MGGIEFHYPEALVSTDWLEHRLDDPNLRVFDCTTYLIVDEGDSRPYRVVSGRTDFDAGHIPGSGHLDLQADFSIKDSRFRFTLPPAREVSKAFERHGVGDNTQVVLYSRKSLPWATRFWWMLRWLGFDSAAVLDGGYDKWNTDGRPVSTDPCRYPAGTLSIKPRPEIFVGKDEVLAGIDASNVCSINALAPELFAGESARYGRPGRIPGSVSVPAMSLLKPGTLEVLAPEAVAGAFASKGPDPNKRNITYCGGGIFATLDAFLLHQLGYRDIAVYDNSMSEWATDDALPIETG